MTISKERIIKLLEDVPDGEQIEITILDKDNAHEVKGVSIRKDRKKYCIDVVINECSEISNKNTNEKQV